MLHNRSIELDAVLEILKLHRSRHMYLKHQMLEVPLNDPTLHEMYNGQILCTYASRTLPPIVHADWYLRAAPMCSGTRVPFSSFCMTCEWLMRSCASLNLNASTAAICALNFVGWGAQTSSWSSPTWCVVDARAKRPLK